MFQVFRPLCWAIGHDWRVVSEGKTHDHEICAFCEKERWVSN